MDMNSEGLKEERSQFNVGVNIVSVDAVFLFMNILISYFRYKYTLFVILDEIESFKIKLTT